MRWSSPTISRVDLPCIYAAGCHPERYRVDEMSGSMRMEGIVALDGTISVGNRSDTPTQPPVGTDVRVLPVFIPVFCVISEAFVFNWTHTVFSMTDRQCKV